MLGQLQSPELLEFFDFSATVLFEVALSGVSHGRPHAKAHKTQWRKEQDSHSFAYGFLALLGGGSR